ncbi:hypothetical protein SBA5_120031 [Candidatus Sulfotelmatomonas gaucii]|uniref:Uncharacterized protein n=1 Tax=Candidatus Sulfuritelmatomonas gaucii TaxID=2043161 RepID=A0A2N9L4Q8_9BACT|nr:hypothetical protein SBA5_120031 [Candidatus Sulfotelmatomonas gaucii]
MNEAQEGQLKKRVAPVPLAVRRHGVNRSSRSQHGWQTRLDAALVEEPERFQSRRLLIECRSFVRLANGNTGAQAGTHDDRVMAMAIGLASRAELQGKYSRTAS